MSRPREISHSMLREWLTYDSNSGVFTWNKKPSPKIKVGQIAGSVDERGYVEIQILGCRNYAHRLAWLYMTGTFPTHEVDHKNGNKSDNSWSNLRDVIRKTNLQNRTKAQRNNTSGFLGVARGHKGKFVARLKVGTTNLYLGSFNTPEAAHAVYVKAKRQQHDGCTL